MRRAAVAGALVSAVALLWLVQRAGRPPPTADVVIRPAADVRALETTSPPAATVRTAAADVGADGDAAGPEAPATPPPVAAPPAPPTTAAADVTPPGAEAPARPPPYPPPPPPPPRTDELIARMQEEFGELRRQLAAQQDRIAQLESDLAEERSRREREAAAAVDRARGLSSLATGVADAEQALATGSSDIAQVLAGARAIAADVATNAGAAGASQEAALAYAAQRWIAASQEAVARGDLYQARYALQLAGTAAARAYALTTTVTAPGGSAY